jgi:hypothetical protein
VKLLREFGPELHFPLGELDWPVAVSPLTAGVRTESGITAGFKEQPFTVAALGQFLRFALVILRHLINRQASPHIRDTQGESSVTFSREIIRDSGSFHP